MTTPEANPETTKPVEAAPQNESKEYNFRALEQLMIQEREARIAAEKKAEEASRYPKEEEDEDEADPYIDRKSFKKKLSSFEQALEKKMEKRAEHIAKNLIETQTKDSWVKQNPDFYPTINKYADEFAKVNPRLADMILQMPDSFERQQLVYENIKALKLDAPAAPPIQDKVDQNRRSPYYQPSGVGSTPYGASGDFSPVGQKEAYNKMKELQNKMRMG
jgi:hypothetical protein